MKKDCLKVKGTIVSPPVITNFSEKNSVIILVNAIFYGYQKFYTLIDKNFNMLNSYDDLTNTTFINVAVSQVGDVVEIEVLPNDEGKPSPKIISFKNITKKLE